MYMNLKSQKGYSLVEIGVGLIIISVFMLSSAGLFRGCASTFRAIKQRNHVINHAVSRVETLLQMDTRTLLTDIMDPEIEDDDVMYLDDDELIDAVDALKETTDGKAKLANGEYYVPADKVIGDFSNSPDTNNMRITTKVRRVPTDGKYAYDETVLKISVLVEYTTKSYRAGAVIPESDILRYELSTIKVTKAEGV